ncbi:hypothetical protein AB0L10_25320 [Streptomyces flaveolus]|uniref:metallophosphoesterase family protein n=1 Tax=Streptomyces flaveolus TaxID=67297 RepID=UPI00342698DB
MTPVNLEVVTLAEDHAIITWYTGEAGTDDGLGRMLPAPADGEVVYGTHPNRLNRVAWLRRGLAAHRDQPTLVFGHHPLVMRDSAFPITPSNTLDQKQAAAVLDQYAKSPGVFLHHAGHTHRNHRTVGPSAPRVVHQEVAAAKEYPGGFSLLRLHEEGYALNFYKSAASRHAGGASAAARRSRGTGRNSRSATTFPTATPSSSAT